MVFLGLLLAAECCCCYAAVLCPVLVFLGSFFLSVAAPVGRCFSWPGQ